MERIKILREFKNITQADLAKLVDVDRSTVAKWEIPGCYPAASKLPEIAKALGCTIDELYKNPSEPCAETA